MTTTAYYLQDKKNWLDFADHAIDLVPKLMPCLFKVLREGAERGRFDFFVFPVYLFIYFTWNV
jgi:hypothetical protein